MIEVLKLVIVDLTIIEVLFVPNTELDPGNTTRNKTGIVPYP